MLYARDIALLATPIGTIRIEGDDAVVHRIVIDPGLATPQSATAAAVGRAAEQIVAWFDGTLAHFDLTLAMPGTPRGAELRDGLVQVGYGHTVTYGVLAQRLNSSARAIGQLCARNPFPIVVPCHRVLASGLRDNYSAGEGLITKRWLLDHEARHGGRHDGHDRHS
ncbi:methylated-DNA-[protein]-cysteine S-methyltransferase [Sphingomonas guangdongensis]|uniref:Methylated-DNA-[protein]-cysteine S-methyltransferase n=1 Tax=Sphingomonas guangdongensis TaxID=1141890 RepID=A0A285QJW8_9SPHN|nr:methylated-DNA--[protein]-cysteine S-methyltransferase [Sphingomonas guangdongensis]SOB80437.1 methylated-DNA-[protein]-cysteine S-methyltransferase [Sphingomonas guangdongensis]